MRNAMLLFLLILFPHLISSKFVIETCSSSIPCNSLLSYLLPFDSKLSEVASRFHINVTDLIGTNGFDLTKRFSGNEIVPQNTLLKVPIPCPCVDGIRRSITTTYIVRPIDTVNSIADGFGGLVSPEQIETENRISGTDTLEIGQSLVIPLPCACFDNTDNGVTVIYMSYVVRTRESLKSVGEKYGTTETDLVAINGLGSESVSPGDILAVPLPACTSAHLHLYSEDLLVPNGSYVLTAFNCVQCACGAKDLNLHCFPSPIQTPCSDFSCHGTNLTIGETLVEPTSTGCNKLRCIYRGHKGHKILSSLSNSSGLLCSGDRKRRPSLPATTFPTVNHTTFPSKPANRTPIPAISCPPPEISSGPTNAQHSGTSVAGGASKSGLGLVALLPFFACLVFD